MDEPRWRMGESLKMRTYNIHKKTNWLRKPMLSGANRNWLVDKGSLTARLKVRYADFAVRPVSLKNTKAFIDESALLGLRTRQHALIREVLLYGNNQPVVFAHSVLPHASLRGVWRSLGKLGNKPLGAALFANPKVKRTPLEYKKLSTYNPISVCLTEHTLLNKQQLWARRSVFTLKYAKILVTEVFLPELLE